ncbi:MAG TPA: S1C family serine protease [Gemmataceae bacterium]|jgi:serine protease Do|nr:S1C family serine protease [Gemmataceae bacterium]
MRIRLFAILWVATGAGVVLADPVTKALPAPPAAATKTLPTSVDELKSIQKHVHDLSDRLIPVTVCLQVSTWRGEQASGSGVIVSEDGLILTAGHVIEGKVGRQIGVVMPDGKRYKATVLGFDKKIDSGMAKIIDPAPGGKWPYADIAPSSELKEGQWVLATGHPGGYKRNRPPVVRVGRIGNPRFEPPREGGEFVQIDCTLVGGDSGGPLFDLRGRVVGIHSRIGNDPRIGASIAQNMDVPSDRYKEAWDKLVAGEIMGASPYLGVRMDEKADNCKLGGVTEPRNDENAPEHLKMAPAYRAGLRTGDIIVRFDGHEVGSYDEMVKLLKEKKPFEDIKIEAKRGDEVKEFKVMIGLRSDE